MEPRTSVWPHDILMLSQPPKRDDVNHLRCFLVCAFKPKDAYEDLFSLVSSACQAVGQMLSCTLECLSADKITSSDVIHAEIWHEIQTSDIVIADVSEVDGKLNGNVLFELGVAAAFRDKQHVLILKEESVAEHFLFDLSPARHITYKRNFAGTQKLYTQLVNAIIECLTPAPFTFVPALPTPTLPLDVDFSQGRDVSWLIGPSITHRRILADCLEFGSLFVFRNSWLAVPNLEVGPVEVIAQMKFTGLRGEGWIGVSIRSHHFFANYGHLLYVNSSGQVVRTVPKSDLSPPDNDIVGAFQDFQPLSGQLYTFRIQADDRNMSMYVDNIGRTVDVATMPYHIPKGRILFQTFNARVGIKKISITER